MKTFSTLAACLTTVVVASGSAHAEHRLSLEELACLLRDQALAVDGELVEDFPGTLQYTQMRAYTLRIEQTAARIENAGRHPNLSRMMHDIEDISRDMRILGALAAEIDTRPFDHFHGHRLYVPSHHRPVIDPECIARLTVLISNMGDTVSRMEQMVVAMFRDPRTNRHVHGHDHRVPVIMSPTVPLRSREVVPVVPVMRPAPAIRFGNGKFAFSLSVR